MYKPKKPLPDVKPLAVKGALACKYLSCEIKKLQKLDLAGEVQSFLEGGVRKYVVASLEAYVIRKAAEGRGQGRNPNPRARRLAEAGVRP